MKGHDAEVCSVAYSPDGKLIVSGGRDKKVIIWDNDTRQVLNTFEKRDYKSPICKYSLLLFAALIIIFYIIFWM